VKKNYSESSCKNYYKLNKTRSFGIEYVLFMIIFFIVLINFQFSFSEGDDLTLPQWIKYNAGWWSVGQISDTEFINGIKWLIENDIILIENTEGVIYVSDSAEKIPSWVRNNSFFWATDKIKDRDFLNSIEYLIRIEVIKIHSDEESEDESKIIEPDKAEKFDENKAAQKIIEEPLFNVFFYKDELQNDDSSPVPLEFHFELIPERIDKYVEIGMWNEEKKAAVIIPIFTLTAYWEPGFYTYFRHECAESCLTQKIKYDIPFSYTSSGNAIKILELLGYEMITDVQVDKNPEILTKYDKIIVLHNEYVTNKEFDAITSHPNVIFLYPNALYAEITTDYQNNSITLIRGHGYHTEMYEGKNAFEWENENTHPYEYDTTCENWEFYKIENGVMLNCYPENVLFKNNEILKEIKATGN